jgi:lipopolysaccharide export system protein LptA
MLGSLFGGDFQFKRIEFADAQFVPNGSVRLVADSQYKVNMTGKQMDLDGEEVVYQPDNKIMVATGKPLKMRMEQLHSECRKMTYDLEKKTIKLEGKPYITQSTKSDSLKMYGNEINLYQNKEGKWGFTISNSGKERTGPGVIEMNSTADADSTATAKAKSEPQKVTRDNAAISIPLPSLAD